VGIEPHTFCCLVVTRKQTSQREMLSSQSKPAASFTEKVRQREIKSKKGSERKR
jgi:hypothetical protein